MLSPGNRRRRFALLTVALGLALGVVMAELALRLVWTPPSLRSVQAFEAHPIFGKAPRPGLRGRRVTTEYSHGFSHTLQGWRDDHAYEAEPPDAITHRVLFLGDSMTYGLGAEDDQVFVQLLDRELPRAECLNTGVNGYGQREQLAVLDRLGPALRPDLVVLMFFWNDLEDNWENDWPAFRVASSGRVEREDSELLPPFDPLALRPAQHAATRSRWRAFYLGRLLKEGIRGFRYRVIGIRPRDIRTPEQLEEAWEVTRRYLAMLDARSREVGSRLVVISIPDHNRVDATARIRGFEPLHFEIEARLEEVLLELEIPYIDPLEAMRAAHAVAPGPLYYYADRHLTPAGNAALAGAVRPFLEEQLALVSAERSIGGPGS